MSETHYTGASADGTALGAVVEIKCPSWGNDKTVAELINSGYEHLSVVDTHAPSSTTHVIDISDDNDDDDGNYSNFYSESIIIYSFFRLIFNNI